MAHVDAIRSILEAHAPEALQTLIELMRHAEHERIRLEAARVILEYGGYKAAAQHDVRLSVDHSHAHVRTVQEAWALRRARLTPGAAGALVEREDIAAASVPASGAPGHTKLRI
jgi:hypothetical protein